MMPEVRHYFPAQYNCAQRMALSSGSKLGPYEIVSALGAGGMGEVYRARDTRLEREVAIKVLPSHLSSNPELKARLEREAKAISSLNHTHICHLYDVGSQDGTYFLVMEYLEGETLERRLQRGPLSWRQVLEYGAQIADALEQAHKQGVIHRDLKPGNIMLTKLGAKVLDFGLAKLRHAPPASGATVQALTADFENKLTERGVVVGTFQYMSPEQLEGGEVDARTDVFALGVLLYEMATGRPPFHGKTKASLIAAILSSDPQPISSVQPLLPPGLDTVVKTCLEKDPENRWQTTHDIKLQLKSILELGSQAAVAAPAAKVWPWRERAGWALLTILLAVAATSAWFLRGRSVAREPIWFEMNTSEGEVQQPAISPSGKQIAYVLMGASGNTQIWIRGLNSLKPRAVPGTERGYAPFWSPDEQLLGFARAGKLNKVEISTGAVQSLSDVGNLEGATWNRNGVIVYCPRYGSGLYRVSASGGDAQPLTQLDSARGETVHSWPNFLPDGTHVLFLQRSAAGQINHISVTSLENKQTVQLTTGDTVVGYTEPRYLLFLRDGVLLAQRFDASRLKLEGPSFLVLDKVGYSADSGEAYASVSANGSLVYQGTAQRERQLVLLDRSGKQLRVVAPPGAYQSLSLSPDEKQVAVDRLDAATGALDIWIWDIGRGVFSRLTTNPANDQRLAWSADQRRMVFSSDRNGMYDMFEKASNGKEELLLKSNEDKIVCDWSRDGKYIIYVDTSPSTGDDIWAMPTTGEHKPFSVVQTPADENRARLSPDGRWLAYVSDESGRSEVYVVSFPDGTARTQISNNGGTDPRWSPNGREMFYISEDRKVMAVDLKAGVQFEAGAPKVLFAAPNGDYAAMQIGQQFLFSSPTAEREALPLTVVVNWASGLKK